MGDPKVVTQLYLGGRLLAVDRWSYASLLAGPEAGRIQAVRARMQAMHKSMLRATAAGAFDGDAATSEPCSVLDAPTIEEPAPAQPTRVGASTEELLDQIDAELKRQDEERRAQPTVAEGDDPPLSEALRRYLE